MRSGEKQAILEKNREARSVESPELKLETATATGLKLPTRSPGGYTAVGELAEGEELGSNLLRVFHRIGTCQIVHTLGGNPGREVAVKGSGGWQQQRRRLSGLVAQE